LQANAAHITYVNSLRSLDNQKQNQQLAQEVLRVSKIKYQQGVGSSIEVTQAQTGLESADNYYIQALYNAISLFFTWFSLANLWLTFSIIINLIPSQGLVTGTGVVVLHWVNSALMWTYLAFLVMQFVLALGNRPKSERTAYSLTIWVFAIISAYLIACSFWLTGVTFVQIHTLFQTKHTFLQALAAIFQPPIGPLLAAMLSTFGIYLIASLLYFDPWHMFTSFPQYLLLAPSFINVLNVYAFCNLHDVSWGTKGSDKAEVLLPSIHSQKAPDVDVPVVEDTTKIQEDVDAAFHDTVKRALTKRSSDAAAPAKRTIDDENKVFRTRLVGLWLLSNAALVVAIQNINGWLNLDDPKLTVAAVNRFEVEQRRKMEFYFQVVLYVAFGLTLVKFIGSSIYWVSYHVSRLFNKS